MKLENINICLTLCLSVKLLATKRKSMSDQDTNDVTNTLVLSFPSIPLCSLINQHLSTLARKFPQTKFIKSISTTCIANYPDHNLPTIFVYFEGEMKAQFIGPLVFGGMNLKVEGRRQLPGV